MDSYSDSFTSETTSTKEDDDKYANSDTKLSNVTGASLEEIESDKVSNSKQSSNKYIVMKSHKYEGMYGETLIGNINIAESPNDTEWNCQMCKFESTILDSYEKSCITRDQINSYCSESVQTGLFNFNQHASKVVANDGGKIKMADIPESDDTNNKLSDFCNCQSHVCDDDTISIINRENDRTTATTDPLNADIESVNRTKKSVNFSQTNTTTLFNRQVSLKCGGNCTMVKCRICKPCNNKLVQVLCDRCRSNYGNLISKLKLTEKSEKQQRSERWTKKKSARNVNPFWICNNSRCQFKNQINTDYCKSCGLLKNEVIRSFKLFRVKRNSVVRKMWCCSFCKKFSFPGSKCSNCHNLKYCPGYKICQCKWVNLNIYKRCTNCHRSFHTLNGKPLFNDDSMQFL